MSAPIRAKLTVAAFVTLAAVIFAVAQMPGGGWFVPNSTHNIKGAKHWYLSNPDADTFYIAKAGELAELASYVNGGNSFFGKVIVLTDNIDLMDYREKFNGGKGWIPIGSAYFDGGYYSTCFGGVFDGNGKTVSNLYINDPNGTYVGLFGCTHYIVKNVGVVGVYVRGRSEVGGLVGGPGGIITNSYTTGWVIGSANTGGLAGTIWRCNILNSYSTATITTEPAGVDAWNIGGLVGGAYAGSIISNCYAAGAVTGTGNVGGLVGSSEYDAENNRPASIVNSAALGPVVMNQPVHPIGRIVGEVNRCTLSNNVAFPGMTLNGLMPTTDTLANRKNGANISQQAINADGTIGNRFTPANGWTVQRGYLPGLFGQVVEMPPHLRLNNRKVSNASSLAADFVLGPNPANRQSGAINFYHTETTTSDHSLSGELTIYDASGNTVKKITVGDSNNSIMSKGADGSVRRQVGSWNLTDAKGRRVPAGTYLVRGTIVGAAGNKERVTLIVGVR